MRRAEGERVGADDAPRLFELLASLQRRLGAPPVDQVFITAEFNASVMQFSRLGLLGRRRTYLLLGLPLMKALTVKQFAAVLAHELGHVVCGHGRQLSPARRIRQLWANLDATFQQTSHPDAVSYPLARNNEYEADAMAARMTSPQGAAQALTNVTLIGCYLEQRYWPDVYAAAREPYNDQAPFSRFDPNGISEVSKTLLRQWHASALKRHTGVSDTHPSLGDRLEALGQRAQFKPPAQGAGADRLLGDVLENIERLLDLHWRKRVVKTLRGSCLPRPV